jgi:hypothetical protein
VVRDPIGFARVQWDTWSPAGWYEEAEFAATAEAFTEPDFARTTLHYYRVRWGASPRDPAYEQLEEKLAQVTELAVPTLLIHGGSDTCIAPGADRGPGRLLHRRLPAGGGARRRTLRSAGGAGHGRRPDPRSAAGGVTRWTAR